jgi:hypothetical protein
MLKCNEAIGNKKEMKETALSCPDNDREKEVRN